MYDICIIGGGASGMTAAIAAARTDPELRICVLEKKEETGKKISATGNGRCNLTNASCRGVREVLRFFGSIGIVTFSDREGRIWPASENAADVVHALRRQMEIMGIDVFTGSSVVDIAGGQRNGTDHFTVISGATGREEEQSRTRAAKILLAAGGKAGPQFGCTGDGYALAKKMGHDINKLFPVLTPIECDSAPALKGIRCRAGVTLKYMQNDMASEEGELQFTADGLSGICIFDLSRHLALGDGRKFSDYCIEADLVPAMNRCTLIQLLTERRDGIRGLKVWELMLSIVDSRLAVDIASRIGDPFGQAADAGDEELSSAAELLKGMQFRVKGAKGWKRAQCTAGGVKTEDIDPETMESKLVPGLYFSGEMIDYDGPCGGYNLNNAWVTALRAGKAMAQNVVPGQSDQNKNK